MLPVCVHFVLQGLGLGSLLCWMLPAKRRDWRLVMAVMENAAQMFA